MTNLYVTDVNQPTHPGEGDDQLVPRSCGGKGPNLGNDLPRRCGGRSQVFDEWPTLGKGMTYLGGVAEGPRYLMNGPPLGKG
jgi:hypothetical protein